MPRWHWAPFPHIGFSESQNFPWFTSPWCSSSLQSWKHHLSGVWAADLYSTSFLFPPPLPLASHFPPLLATMYPAWQEPPCPCSHMVAMAFCWAPSALVCHTWRSCQVLFSCCNNLQGLTESRNPYCARKVECLTHLIFPDVFDLAPSFSLLPFTKLVCLFYKEPRWFSTPGPLLMIPLLPGSFLIYTHCQSLQIVAQAYPLWRSSTTILLKIVPLALHLPFLHNLS